MTKMRTLSKREVAKFDNFLRNASERARKELDRRKKKWLGAFNTGLPCNCGAANITDHAKEHEEPWDGRFRPEPTAQELLERFQVAHSYRCDTCGAKYDVEVVEGTRGYVPPDRKK